MNAVRRKLADLLLDMSEKAMDGLDAENPCTKAMKMKGADRSALLRSDIERICTEISMVEAGRVLATSARLRSSSAEAAEGHRKKLVDIATKVLARVEKKSGPLNLPLECRHFLVSLSENP
jgi:hypothetical protein